MGLSFRPTRDLITILVDNIQTAGERRADFTAINPVGHDLPTDEWWPSSALSKYLRLVLGHALFYQ